VGGKRVLVDEKERCRKGWVKRRLRRAKGKGAPRKLGILSKILQKRAKEGEDRGKRRRRGRQGAGKEQGKETQFF